MKTPPTSTLIALIVSMGNLRMGVGGAHGRRLRAALVDDPASVPFLRGCPAMSTRPTPDPGSGEPHLPAAIAATVWLGVALGLTLYPTGGGDAIADPLCIVCGERGVANLLANMLLLAPLGALLAWTFPTSRANVALLAPFALSVAIESLQLAIPGRNPAAIDVIANGAGGMLGWVAGRWALRIQTAIHSRGRLERRIAWLLCVSASVAALIGTGAGFRPHAPDAPARVVWNERVRGLARWDGDVESVRWIGAGPLERGEGGPAPELLEPLLSRGDVLRIEARLGEARGRRLAGIVAIVAEDRSPLFVVGARGNDLVALLPIEADRVRLDRPDLSFPGALDGVGPGAEIEIEVRFLEGDLCVWVARPGGRSAACGLGHSLAEGWALLSFPSSLPPAVRTALGFLWILSIGGLAGFFTRSTGGALWAALLLSAVAAAVALGTSTLAGFGPAGVAALSVGAVLGRFAGSYVRGEYAPLGGEYPPLGEPG